MSGVMKLTRSENNSPAFLLFSAGMSLEGQCDFLFFAFGEADAAGFCTECSGSCGKVDNAGVKMPFRIVSVIKRVSDGSTLRCTV